MSKKRKTTSDADASDPIYTTAITTWARIREIELKLHALTFACRATYASGWEGDQNVREASSTISGFLYRELTRTYENLFMLGVVTDNSKLRRAIAKVVYNRAFQQDHALDWFAYEKDKPALRRRLDDLAKTLFSPGEIDSIEDLNARHAASDAWEVRQLELGDTSRVDPSGVPETDS